MSSARRNSKKLFNPLPNLPTKPPSASHSKSSGLCPDKPSHPCLSAVYDKIDQFLKEEVKE